MPNQIDLTTEATAAASLGIANSPHLARLITAASRAIARHVGYDMHLHNASETVSTVGGPYLFLNAGQLNSITSIQMDGAPIDSSLYAIDNALMGRIRGVRYSFAYRGSGVGITGLPMTAVPEVVVSYSAGWVTPGQNALDAGTYPAVTLPEDIEHAAIGVVVAWYRRKGQDSDIASFGLGEASVTLGDRSAIPVDSRALLRPYRKLVRRMF